MTNKKIFSNILSLGVVQIADYVIPLIAIPFLMRVIGIENYGYVALVQALSVSLLVVADYGFNFSATRLVAVQKDDFNRLSQTFWSIQAVKFLIFLLLAAVVAGIYLYSHIFIQNPKHIIFFAALLPLIGTVFYPIWLFQGLELIKQSAIIFLIVRFILLGLIFIFVKSEDDFLLAGVLLLAGSPVAGLVCSIIIVQSKRLGFYIPTWKDIIFQFRDGWHIFLASASSNLYRSANSLVIGVVLGPVSVAYYSVAEKVVKAFQEFTRPLVQATFPRVSYLASHDPQQAMGILKKLLLGVVLVTFSGLVVLTVFSPEIVKIISGHEQPEIVFLLRIMSVIPVIGGINSVLGVQSLLPFKLNNYFSRFVIRTGIFSGLIIFPMVALLGTVGASLSYLFSELFLLVALLRFHASNGISILKEQVDIDRLNMIKNKSVNS